MSEHREIWDSLISGPHSRVMLHTAMESVACSLTDMIGQVIINDAPQVKKVPIAQVVARAGDSGAPVVGIYLQMESGLYGRVILIIPLSFALNLVDLMMDTTRDTVNGLGPVELSALAEVGNLTLSYFLNAVADLIGKSEMLHPSPPTVIVDMLSVILNMVVTPAAAASDDLLIVETVFADVTKNVKIRFWVLPDLKNNGAQVNGKTLHRHLTSNDNNSKVERTKPTRKSPHSGGPYA